jgi:dinuclear metal center YbgI/SA1388 family protein
MKTSEIINLIESHAPTVFAASWDNSGVQVAGREREVAKLAVALDPLPETIASAIESGARFVLTHHPLTLEPRLPNKLDGFHEVLRMLLSTETTLFSSHTSLDVQIAGPVSWPARELGLENIKVLDETARTEDGEILGFGCIGSLSSAMSFDDFAGKVAELSGCSVLSVCGPLPEKVATVAMCPGSGSSMMDEAFKAGADVYITGDVKYHPAQEAGGAVIDVGHFSLEEEMMRRFALVLRGELEPNGVDVQFFKGHDPFAYYVDGIRHKSLS